MIAHQIVVEKHEGEIAVNSVLGMGTELVLMLPLNTNLDRAQHHYNTAHQLFTRLGALKDLERLEQEWAE